MTQELDQKISSLIKATDEMLWDSYHLIPDAQPRHQLIFPKTSKGTIRVSEQEARQSLIRNLIGTPFNFSVETPTVGEYGPSGNGKRNALTDLTLYADTKPCMNIEFKYRNTSPKRCNKKHINKDIEKLVFEEVNGLWFHVLETANNKGISYLWDTIKGVLKSNVKGKLIKNKLLVFHCCVLKEGYSVQTSILLNEDGHKEDWLNELPNPPDTKAWIVHKFNNKPI